jgi:hypothetical protein
MRARACCSGAAALLLCAAPASASHSHPATYTGGVTGGSLEFDVSADGTAITRLRIVAVSECARHDLELDSRIAIVDHAFDFTSTTLWFGGRFDAPRSAQGTVRYHQDFPACTSTLRDWSAMTSAPADTTAPQVALSGPTTQRAGRTVAVTVTSGEPASARVSGRVGRRALRARSATLAAHAPTRIALDVPVRARRAVRRALRDGRRVRAVITVRVRDAAGNVTQRTRTVRLRR